MTTKTSKTADETAFPELKTEHWCGTHKLDAALDAEAGPETVAGTWNGSEFEPDPSVSYLGRMTGETRSVRFFAAGTKLHAVAELHPRKNRRLLWAALWGLGALLYVVIALVALVSGTDISPVPGLLPLWAVVLLGAAFAAISGTEAWNQIVKWRERRR